MFITAYNAGYADGRKDISLMGAKATKVLLENKIDHGQNSKRYIKGYKQACDEYDERRKGYNALFGGYMDAKRYMVHDKESNAVIKAIVNSEIITDSKKDSLMTLWWNGVFSVEDILDEM